MQQIEPFQPQYSEASPGEMVESGAAHPAEPDNDDVVDTQKLTLRMRPSVPTSHPAFPLANATAQKFETPGRLVQV